MKWLESPVAEISLPKNKDQLKIAPLKKNDHIDLSDNSRTILEKRYIRKNKDGTPSETVEGLFDRIASAVAKADEGYKDVGTTTVEFCQFM